MILYRFGQWFCSVCVASQAQGQDQGQWQGQAQDLNIAARKILSEILTHMRF